MEYLNKLLFLLLLNGQPRTQASSRYLSYQRRLGTKCDIACSQTLYFLFKVRRGRVIKYKSQGIYWPPAQGGQWWGKKKTEKRKEKYRLSPRQPAQHGGFVEPGAQAAKLRAAKFAREARESERRAARKLFQVAPAPISSRFLCPRLSSANLQSKP